MAARLTINAINKAIAALGGEETLQRGNGYFYFWDGTAPSWHTSSVMVPRLNDLTLAQWIDDYKSLKAAGDAR